MKASLMGVGAFLLVLGILLIFIGPLLQGEISSLNYPYAFQQSFSYTVEALILAGTVAAPIGAGVLAYGYATGEDLVPAT